MTTGAKNRTPTEVIIEEREIPLFLAFKRHQDQFQVMLDAGVFELPYGKATITMHDGRVQAILVEKRVYQYVIPIVKSE